MVSTAKNKIFDQDTLLDNPSVMEVLIALEN
jgi:hypothetical protein